MTLLTIPSQCWWLLYPLTLWILWKFIKFTSEQRAIDKAFMRGFGHIPAHELQWTDEPVIGASLTLTFKMLKDSHGNTIDDNKRYWVAKHLPTGHLVIVEVPEDVAFNQILKETNKLN